MLSHSVTLLFAFVLPLVADATPYPGVCVWNGRSCDMQQDALDAKIRPLHQVCDGISDCDYPFDVNQHVGRVAAARCETAKNFWECRHQAVKQGTYVDIVVHAALVGMKDRLRTLCYWSEDKCELDRVLLSKYFHNNRCIRRRAVANAMKARCLEAQSSDVCAPASNDVYRFADIMASMYTCA